jgi:multidrug efflux pump
VTAKPASGGPSRPFILRPVATTLLMIALMLAGFIAWKQLPLSALPQVDYPTIQVRTLYPGASPDVMALTVTSPLERQFGQMPGLTRMTSNSSAGASGHHAAVRAEPVARCGRAGSSGGDQRGQFAAALRPARPAGLCQGEPGRRAGHLGGIIENPPAGRGRDCRAPVLEQDRAGKRRGSGQHFGRPAPRRAHHRQSRPLAPHGISLETLRTAISNANANMAKGTFDGPTKSWTIDANDQLGSAEDYAKLIVSWSNGAPIRLSDVAKVESSTENIRTASWMNRTPAVIIDVQRQPGANVIQTVDSIKADLPGLEAQLPADMKVTLLTDRTSGIRASVEDVQFELVLAVVLVVLVIFLFLGRARDADRGAFGAAVAGGRLCRHVGAGLFDQQPHADGADHCLGLVVDDAIVVIENIARHIEDGMKPFDAALKGASEIGFTIISLTVSLVAVLIPLLFMGDVVGRLFREFAVSLAVTIVLSAVVALTLVPMLAARWLRPEHEERRFRLRRQGMHAFDRLAPPMPRARLGDGAPAPDAAGLCGSMAITALLFVVIPKNLFPTQDTGQISATVIAAMTPALPAWPVAGRGGRCAAEDPAVDSLSPRRSAWTASTDAEPGAHHHQPEIHQQRGSLSTVMADLQDRASGAGREAVSAAGAGSDHRHRNRPDALSLCVEGADQNAVNEWGNKLAGALQGSPAAQCQRAGAGRGRAWWWISTAMPPRAWA